MSATIARSLRITAVLWLSSAVVGAQSRFEYAAGAAQYRFTSLAKLTQSMMGQSQNSEQSNMRLVSLTLSRLATDTIAMTVVLDSVNMVGAMGMAPMGADKLPGSKFAVKVAPSGALYTATGPSEAENPLAASMTNDIGKMLPVIKAALAVGASWVDTILDKPKQGPLELERRVISSFRVVGDTNVGGEPAWKIQRETSAAASGQGGPPGQVMTLTLSGAGKGVLVMSKKGVLLGGENEDKSEGKAVAVASGMEIGLLTITTTKVVKVR